MSPAAEALSLGLCQQAMCSTKGRSTEQQVQGPCVHSVWALWVLPWIFRPQDTIHVEEH